MVSFGWSFLRACRISTCFSPSRRRRRISLKSGGFFLRSGHVRLAAFFVSPATRRSSLFFCAATAQYGFPGEPFCLSSALTVFGNTPNFFAMSGASKFSQFFSVSLSSRSNSMRPSKVRWPFLSVKLLRCSGSIRVVSSDILSCASSARASSPVAAGAPAGGEIVCNVGGILAAGSTKGPSVKTM